MTSRPQPLRSWRLLALVAGLAGGLAVVERLAGLPSATWPSDTVPRISAAVSALPPGEIASRHPVLSLVMDAADLQDPERGILANVLEHGRDWERPGTVAYFDDGQLRFATGVGVRVHGGGSRKSSPRQGFRLYFRREYGARQLPPDVLFSTDAQPVRHLVIHNDVRDGRHFANPLAYDIAREVGAITAETSPVRFFLNGEFYGVFVLTERFDEQYFQAHWGHDRIDWTDEEMQSFWEWSVQHRPMTMADVAKKADVEGLARWFLATAFMATRDAYQGPGQYLDSSRTPPRWFWVNWDMDGSFRSFDLDSYADLLNRVDELQRGRSHTEPRSNLLTTLFAEDDAFRTFYKRLFVAVMNHHLTPEFLERRLDYYRRAGQQLGVTDTKYLREYATFLERRPAFFRKLTESWLNTGPSQPLALGLPAGESITIDGEAARDGFEGLYFPDLEIALQASGENFEHWEVDGESKGTDRTLRLRVERPRFVEAVYRGKPRAKTRRPSSPADTAAPGEPADRLSWVPVTAPAGGTTFQMLTHEVTVAAFSAFAAAHDRTNANAAVVVLRARSSGRQRHMGRGAGVLRGCGRAAADGRRVRSCISAGTDRRPNRRSGATSRRAKPICSACADRTGSNTRLRSDRSAATVTGCTTWLATSGSGRRRRTTDRPPRTSSAWWLAVRGIRPREAFHAARHFQDRAATTCTSVSVARADRLSAGHWVLWPIAPLRRQRRIREPDMRPKHYDTAWHRSCYPRRHRQPARRPPYGADHGAHTCPPAVSRPRFRPCRDCGIGTNGSLGANRRRRCVSPRARRPRHWRHPRSELLWRTDAGRSVGNGRAGLPHQRLQYRHRSSASGTSHSAATLNSERAWASTSAPFPRCISTWSTRTTSRFDRS